MLTVFHDCYDADKAYVEEFLDLMVQLMHKSADSTKKLDATRLHKHISNVYGLDIVEFVKTKMCPSLKDEGR